MHHVNAEDIGHINDTRNVDHISIGETGSSARRSVQSKTQRTDKTFMPQCEECARNISYQATTCRNIWRAKCYSEQIRQRILESTEHIEDPTTTSRSLQEILWRHKILFDPTPSIVNIRNSNQQYERATIHPCIPSNIPRRRKDQLIKHEETKETTRTRPDRRIDISVVVSRCPSEEKGQNRYDSVSTTDGWTQSPSRTLFHCRESTKSLTSWPTPSIFTKFDSKSGYFQIPLSEEERPKTAFSTRDNHYQFTVLPQGITNGPATFQRIVNHVLGPNSMEIRTGVYWRYYHLLENVRRSPRPHQRNLPITETSPLSTQSGEVRNRTHQDGLSWTQNRTWQYTAMPEKHQRSAQYWNNEDRRWSVQIRQSSGILSQVHSKLLADRRALAKIRTDHQNTSEKRSKNDPSHSLDPKKNRSTNSNEFSPPILSFACRTMNFQWNCKQTPRTKESVLLFYRSAPMEIVQLAYLSKKFTSCPKEVVPNGTRVLCLHLCIRQMA